MCTSGQTGRAVQELGARMKNTDRRVRRTHKSLHDALISLLQQRKYDKITIQDILERADIGRSTFYTHFDDKDDLLVSGVEHLRAILEGALRQGKCQARGHERVIAFSRAMFEHVDGFRRIYQSLLNTAGWPLVRRRIEELLDELIRRECKAEIDRARKAKAEVPIELFVYYLTSSVFSVITWWIDSRSRLTPDQIDSMFRRLVLPTVNSYFAE